MTESQVRASRGYSQQTVLKAEKETPAPFGRSIAARTLRAHVNAVKRVDEYLQQLKRPCLYLGRSITRLEDLVDLPFPPINFWRPVIHFVILSTVGRSANALPKRSTIEGWSLSLGAWWYRHAQSSIPSETRQAIAREIRHFKHEGQLLPHLPLPKAELSLQSINALIDGTFSSDVPLSVERRLTYALWIALQSSTGARPMCSLRCGPQSALHQQGMTFGDADIWIFPPTAQNQPCRLVGYWKTKYNKTKSRMKTFFPLPPGPSLVFTVPHMLLILLVARGLLAASDILAILFPPEVPLEVRRLIWPEEL